MTVNKLHLLHSTAEKSFAHKTSVIVSSASVTTKNYVSGY